VTKHYVLGLEVVTPTGEIIHTGGLTTKNVVGFDLTMLMTGSEGLLGIITKATLRLVPLPEATRTLRATFDSMRAACACVPAFTRAGITPLALEVIDRNSIEAVESEYSFGFDERARAVVLTSVDGRVTEVEDTARRIEELLREYGGRQIILATTREEEERIWDVRRALSPALKKYGSLKLNEDVVVPRSRVPELIKQVEEIAARHKTFVANFGHAADGNIHVNFICDGYDKDARARARACVRDVFAASVSLGGTISGEHGIGYVKAPYLHMALSPETIATMKTIKRALDPNGILNPGKMFV
jgi:glycolate oxidase